MYWVNEPQNKIKQDIIKTANVSYKNISEKYNFFIF